MPGPVKRYLPWSCVGLGGDLSLLSWDGTRCIDVLRGILGFILLLKQ